MKKHLQSIVIMALVAAAWVFLFAEHLSSLVLTHWATDDYSYCYLVPPLALYFLWLGRRKLTKASGRPVWPGFALVAGAGLLFFVGRVGSLETLIYLAMLVSLLGLALIMLGGRSFSALAFPFLVLLFSVPPPAFLGRLLSFNLKLISSKIAIAGLQLISVPAFRDGNLIEMGGLNLQVVDACSGLRYFFPTILVGLVIGRLFLREVWPRVVLVLAAAPVSILTNSLRLFLTGVLVEYVDPSLARGFFHDFSGLAVNLSSVLILAGLMMILRRFEGASVPIFPDRDGNFVGLDETTVSDPPVERDRPLMTWRQGAVICALLIGLHAFQSLYLGSMVIPERTSFDRFPLVIEDWQGQRFFLDKGVTQSLGADDYIQASYTSSKTHNTLVLLIPYYQTQTTLRSAHHPATCLISGGWSVEKKQILDPKPGSPRGFSVHQMVLGKNGNRVVSNFWFDQRGRVVTNEYANKIYQFVDAVRLRRTDGALVRVEMLLLPNQSVEQGQEILDQFLARLKPILPAYLPGTSA